MRASVVVLAALLALGSPASAQHQRQHQHAAPYAGLQDREIKALSSQQIEDLKAGRGMELALAAELNGYPGPLHVLELAEPLELSDAQRRRTEELIAAVKAEAAPLGEELIAREAELDRLFAERSVTPEKLSSAVRRVAEAQAALREAHLKYHLVMKDKLTPAQVERYRRLRGYSGEHTPGR